MLYYVLRVDDKLPIIQLRATNNLYTPRTHGGDNIMWRDTIIEEVRRNRQVYATRFHHDIKANLPRRPRATKEKQSQDRFIATATCQNSC